MKILLFLLSLIWAMPAWADGPALFKDFSYGQLRTEIQQLPDIYACDDVQEGALCRSQQSFANYDGWEQIFLFTNDKLDVVVLFDDTNKNLYNITGVLTNSHYFAAVIQAGDKIFDFIQAINEHGFESAVAKLTQTETAFLNGNDSVTYTFCPANILKSAITAGNFSNYLLKAPTSLRATEVIVSNDSLTVRFLAPVAALHDIRKQMNSQTESF